MRIKKTSKKILLVLLAGAVGFEPTTNGFGDHYSTVEPYPFNKIYFIIVHNNMSISFFPTIIKFLLMMNLDNDELK